MLVEPFADVEVNVPGVMAMLVAPVVAQLSVLLEPEAILVGLAAKDVIVGTEPFPEGEPDELAEPQAARPAQAHRVRTSAQRCSPEESSRQELGLYLQNELEESIRNPFAAVGHTSLVMLDLSCLLAASTESGPGPRGLMACNPVRAMRSSRQIGAPQPI
jgi:hypothetical protein